MKRFSETDKWRDPWFQALPHGSKLLFLYLIDNCNNAGFYEENVRETCFQLGIDEGQYKGALKGLERGIKGASGWLWVRRFLRHQKNEPLNPSNPAHKQIITLISEQRERFGPIPEFQSFVAPYKGLFSPIGIGIGKGTGKGKNRESVERENHAPHVVPTAEDIYNAYPLKAARPDALRAITRCFRKYGQSFLLERTMAFARARNGDTAFCPHPATWFNDERFNDDPSTWIRTHGTDKKHTTESGRNLGTTNEGKSSQYKGVGKVQ